MSPYPTTRPSSSRTRIHSGFRSSFASHVRISSASIRRTSPKAVRKSAATSSASSTRSSLSGNELIERLGKLEQIGQLARRRRGGRLAEPVDPDAAQAELVRRRDVVKLRRRDVYVPFARGARALEELLPVAVIGLVRPD